MDFPFLFLIFTKKGKVVMITDENNRKQQVEKNSIGTDASDTP